MLLSMTGFGEARGMVAGSHVLAELRGVNNRHLKVTVRCPDAWNRHESDMERVIRESVTRGTLSLSLKRERHADASTLQLNPSVLGLYYRQLKDCAAQLGVPVPTDLAVIAQLPGVAVSTEEAHSEGPDVWPELEPLVRSVVGAFQEFRTQEGAAMSAELLSQCGNIEAELDRIAALAPQVIHEYRDRLRARIAEALRDAQVTVDGNDLIREVAVFADRCDISEEIVRLRSHIDQFRQLARATASQGRKLDFLCQELFREANTIGSKANHVGIAHAALEMKTTIERIREVVQNVE